MYCESIPLIFQFGGNPVACSIANAVLDVIENEKLQEHAKNVGNYWLQRLNEIKDDYPIIGDVRYVKHFNYLYQCCHKCHIYMHFENKESGVGI